MSLGGWGLANPAGLAWGLLAVPIVALHVLRPRRVQATVAAVFLWRRVATPVSAARPWQRLIPSWLLAAQVVAALLLGLLMARPVRLSPQALADHTIFVVDASASMQATDGTPDRLATARDKARELRRQVPAGGRASLIVAGRDARALLTSSNDTSAFDAAVATIAPYDGTADFATAFALAAGLDTGDTDSRVVLISDGGLDPAALRAAPVGTRYEPVGSSATNRGITQLSVEPAGQGLLARVTVTSFGGPPASQTVRVDVDGVTLARAPVELGPGAVANLAIPLPAAQAGAQKVEAFLEGDDALALDDRAVATIAGRPEIQVLWAGPDNPFLDAALAAVPGLQITRTAQVPATVDPAVDVVVADRVPVPAGLALPLLAIAPPGGARGITAAGAVDRPAIALVRSDTPLLAGLDLSQVGVAQAQALTVPGGAQVLVGAEGAPLVVETRSPAPTVYLGFALDQSTLPLDLAFPLLVDRAMSTLSGQVVPPARLTVGADLPLDPRLEATVTGPDGTSQTIPPGSSHPRADRIGFWAVTQAERRTLVAVGPDRAESAIAPVADLPLSTAFAGTGPALRRGQTPFLSPVVAVLLVLLAAEWLLARRRLGVGRHQWRVATGARVAVALALLAVLLAPGFTRRTDDLATLFLVDASDSMTATGRAQAVALVEAALEGQPRHSRAGVVVFGNDARLETLVGSHPAFSGVSVKIDPAGTDVAAALRLGAAALPPDARRRLVLISDGRATTGDAAAEADRLRTDGVPVDVAVVDPPGGDDLAVTAIDVPGLARRGEKIDIAVQVTAPRPVAAEVVLRRDGTEVGRQTVALVAGANTVRFADVAAGDGVLRYQAQVTRAGDGVAANDVGYAAVPVEGADQVLVVDGRAGAGDGLVAALGAAGLTVQRATPASLPAVDALTRFASIVLVDVDRRDLSTGQVRDLTAAVHDLGRGLVVVGGTHSYALGGYRNSDLEQLLPVESDLTDPLRRQTVAEVLAIDTSGSMGACHCSDQGLNGLGGGSRISGGVSKTAIARTAAARAIAALSADDQVGVLSMDAHDRWVVDLQAAPSQATVDAGLGQIVPNGPTFLDTGLDTAAAKLRRSNANLKHIIFFSDGFTEPAALARVANQARSLAAEGITVSVVATGEGAAPQLKPIAEAGGGRYYPGRNLDEVPDLIAQEAVLASRDYVNEGDFRPTVTSSRPPVARLTASPDLLGYVATTARPAASVDLIIGPDKDPLLASWRTGLGRVTAWTSDGGERWAAPWAGWAGNPDFWAGVVKDTFPVAGGGGSVRAKVVDGQLDLRLEGTKPWPQDASAIVQVAGPDGSSTPVTLERLDASTFAARVPVGAAGTYALGGVVSGADGPVWSGVGLATRSYPAEYAPAPVGRDELTRLADQTGGRVDPGAGELFSRAGTRAGHRRVDLTGALLLFAVLAWPLAVAVSRLSWRRGLLAVGAERASGTVSELRRRLPRLAEPALRPASSAPAPAGPTSPAAQPARHPDPPVDPSAPTAPAAQPAPGPHPPVDPSGPAAPGAEDGGGTVAELLARKRRRGG